MPLQRQCFNVSDGREFIIKLLVVAKHYLKAAPAAVLDLSSSDTAERAIFENMSLRPGGIGYTPDTDFITLRKQMLFTERPGRYCMLEIVFLSTPFTRPRYSAWTHT